MIRTEFDPIDYQQIRELRPAVLQIDRREARQLCDCIEYGVDVDMVPNSFGELVDDAQGWVEEPGRVAYVILRIVHSEV